MKKKVKLLGLSLVLSFTLYSCAVPTSSTPVNANAQLDLPKPQSSASPSANGAPNSSEKSKELNNSDMASITTSPSLPAASPSYNYPNQQSTFAGIMPPNTSTDNQKIGILPEEEKIKNNVFKDYGNNTFISTEKVNLSTFGLDVDTASYTWMRKSLENNINVNKDSVRVEEYINYFDYNYPQPIGDNKFSLNTELFNIKNTNVLKIGLQGLKIDNSQRKNAHLSLVVDVSGSMAKENRLSLVKESLKLLVKSLTDKDFISITVFGNQARNLLSYSNDKTKIINIIDSLETEGSTNTEAGLNLGYLIAKQNYKTGAINKVILCSDGYANVGDTNPDILLNKIKQDSISGISLSTIGFGMGNYNDVLLEQLADKGDGSYAYVDSLKEAERIFIQNLTGTIQTIAKDAKIQIAFNPNIVSEYRLIGYENRNLPNDAFLDDKVDAGDVGSNQSVTALYEIKLKENTNSTINIANVSLRYKDIDQNLAVKEMSQDIKLNQLISFNNTSNDSKIALSSAIYAEILRQGYWNQLFNFDDVLNYLSKVEQTEKIKNLTNLVIKAKTLK